MKTYDNVKNRTSNTVGNILISLDNDEQQLKTSQTMISPVRVGVFRLLHFFKILTTKTRKPK